MSNENDEDDAAGEARRAAGADGAAARYGDYLHRLSKVPAPNAALAPAILPTSVYALPGTPAGPHQYGRWTNPGWTELEESLGFLEGGSAVVFPSGAAAVTALLASILRPGDRLLLQSDGYMGTRTIAQRYFAGQGIVVETCPTRDIALRPLDGLRLALLETPSNPGLDLLDIRDCARRVHASGGLLVIDNTLMTPLGQQPLDLGADASVYSDTKLINGHSDAVFGHVCSRRVELIAGVLEWRRVCGAIPGPFETWMVQRGLETLELRVARMQANALALAQALRGHPALRALCHPGLAEHPQHALATAQMMGYGSMLCLTLADQASADRFIGACRYLRACTSFGGVHSSAERRARWGDPVADGFVRIAVGCEPTEALCRELRRALDAPGP